MSEARDKLRQKVLATVIPLTKTITFFGAEIEIRQITLGDVIRSQKAQQEGADPQAGMVQMLIDYAFVPGTDEHVFELADRDALMEQPFGHDFVRVSEAIAALTTVDFSAPKQPSKETPSTLQ